MKTGIDHLKIKKRANCCFWYSIECHYSDV